MPGFGQNGSVAWVVVGKVVGGKRNENTLSPHPDGWRGEIEDPPVKNFLVRLRFADIAAADTAWADKVQQTLPNGEIVVILKVPAQPVNTARTPLDLNPDTNEPNVNPPWEVGVDWEFVNLV